MDSNGSSEVGDTIKNIKFFLLTILVCIIFAQSKEVVILLHGVLRTPMSMKIIELRLEKEGFDVLNYGYHSRQKIIENHAKDLAEFLQTQEFEPTDTVHFVTHSMGSLVARYFLSHYKLNHAGRFVMIAPPNQGSSMADYLSEKKWYRWIWGAPAEQFLTADSSFAKNAGIPPREFGIIAGGKGDGAGWNPIISGDDDGTVSVEQTKLDSMKDFIVIRNLHSLLLWDKEAVEQIVAFLKNGEFERR